MIQQTLLHGILQITLEAEKGNQLGTADIVSLTGNIRAAREDCTVKGLLLTGAGQAFCTGLNLQGDAGIVFRLFDELLYELFVFPKPVVAAVNGHSIGGGLLLQACADYSIMADHTRIKTGLPEIKLGMTIDRVMLELLNFSATTHRQLATLLLTSELIAPPKVVELGLADALSPGENLLDTAIEHLTQLISQPAESYRITKELIKKHAAEGMKQGLDQEDYRIFININSGNGAKSGAFSLK